MRADKLKKAMQARSGGEDPVDKRRQELAALAGRLDGLVNQARRGLVALGALARAAGQEAVVAESCGALLAALLPLLPSPLVEHTAFDALLELCRAALQPSLQPAARDLADSLRLLAKLVSAGELVAPANTKPAGKKAARDLLEWQQRHKRVAELSGPPVRFLKGLAASLGRSQGAAQASTATLQLCFPMFRGLLQLHALVPGCELALALLSALWPSSRVPPEMRPLLRPLVETCLVALANLRLDPSPEGLVLRALQQEQGGLCQEDWAPLLGDYGLLNSAANVRLACVRALAAAGEGSLAAPDLALPLSCRLFLARHDDDEAVKALADTTWDAWLARRPQLLPAAFIDSFLPLLRHDIQGVRDAAGRALASGLLVFPESAPRVATEIQAAYKTALPTKAEDTFSKVGRLRQSPAAPLCSSMPSPL